MPNVRIIAKGQRGDSLTKLKVNFAPSQSSTPSLMPETNSVYLTRPTEGTGELMELVGGSVAWNQLVQNANKSFSNSSTDTRPNVSFLFRKNSSPWTILVQKDITAVGSYDFVTAATFSGTTQIIHSGLQNNFTFANNISVENGHKYLLHIKFTGVTPGTVGGVVSDDFMLIDLTQMFGSTIADYVYSLEQSTAGSGIAWLQQYGYFTEDYIAYSAPTLQSVEATAHVTKDANNTTIATYPLDSDLVLRGIPKLSNGNLYYDGDTYEWDGTVTRKYAEVDLGTLRWYYNSTNAYFYAKLTEAKGVPNAGTAANIICDKYINHEWTGISDKQISRFYASQDGINVKDSSYTDATTFKTAMSGHYLVYELATPTTESADPFTAVQTVEDGGTEEFVTTNGVPVGVVGRFANAVPMEGVDSFTVTANDGTSHTYPVTLSEEIYRGYVDMLTGEAVSEAASIAEYNGETISEPWLSSLDVYSAGATPTKGAQVVYPITPEEVTATITGDPTELGEVTSASSTEGTVEWSAMAPLDGKCIVRVVS